MRVFQSVVVPMVLCAALAGVATSASAADTCSSFITALPAVITGQGVWCMNGDLNMAGEGTAIDIRTNNVTVDCQGFKLQGAGGVDTRAITAGDRINITIRNCAIGRFVYGILIGVPEPGSGHLIEDNRLDQIGRYGIYVLGQGSIVRRNRVINSGGVLGAFSVTAITVTADAIDTVVDGVFPGSDMTDFNPNGISAGGFGGVQAAGF